MTLLDWLTAGDVADRELEEEAIRAWVIAGLRNPQPGTLTGRTGAGRPRRTPKRRWSRARIRKAIERWLALLGPFAALAAAIIQLL